MIPKLSFANRKTAINYMKISIETGTSLRDKDDFDSNKRDRENEICYVTYRIVGWTQILWLVEPYQFSFKFAITSYGYSVSIQVFQLDILTKSIKHSEIGLYKLNQFMGFAPTSPVDMFQAFENLGGKNLLDFHSFSLYLCSAIAKSNK
jgi:hypothetical protein